MRIPTSVIVMTCVTAVPFGLAIRSTVIERREAREAVELAQRQERERVQQRLEDERRQAQLAAAEKATHDALLASLFGTERATLGPAFGFALDDRPPGTALTTLETTLSALTPTFERGRDDHVIGVLVWLGAEDCDAVRTRIEAVWGKGDAYGVWLDRVRHHRTTITGTECNVRFDDYVDVDGWMKLVPLDFVGKPVAEALRVMGPAQEMVDDDLAWHLPGLPSGTETTSYTLRVRDNTIRQISVHTSVVPSEVPELVDALAARFKSAPVADDPATPANWTWKRSPPTTAGSDGTWFVLQIGAAPTSEP